MCKSAGGTDRRRAGRRSATLSLVLLVAVIAPSFEAGHPIVSPIAQVTVAAAPNPGPGGGDEGGPAPKPTKTAPSSPTGGSGPEPAKPAKPAPSDSRQGNAAAAETPKPVPPKAAPQTDPGNTGHAPARPEPAARAQDGVKPVPPPAPAAGQLTEPHGANAAKPTPSQPGSATEHAVLQPKPDRTPSNGALPSAPPGTPKQRLEEATRQSSILPKPGTEQDATVGQVVPLGLAQEQAGVVKPASMTINSQTMQICLGGAGCQATPSALPVQPTATAMPPRKENPAVLIGGAAVVDAVAGTTLTAGAIALTAAAGTALVGIGTYAADGISHGISSLLGNDEVHNVVDPTQPAPPNTANPAEAAASGYQPPPQIGSTPTPENPVAQQSSPPAGVKPGWGSRPADNGKGTVYQDPARAGVDNGNQVRVMDPGANPRYPDGYVRFYGKNNQPLKLDGKPGSNAETHFPRRPDGSYDLPKGW